MDDRPRVHSLTQCYHEAGHAVALWHHDIRLRYVTMNPSAGSGNWGQTVPVEREIAGLAQIEAEMRCAVAGQIAESEFLPNREKLRAQRTDNSLTRRFKRNAERATEDPNLPDTDDLLFAKMGIARDGEICKTGPDAATGPASWIPVFRCGAQSHRTYELT